MEQSAKSNGFQWCSACVLCLISRLGMLLEISTINRMLVRRKNTKHIYLWTCFFSVTDQINQLKSKAKNSWNLYSIILNAVFGWTMIIWWKWMKSASARPIFNIDSYSTNQLNWSQVCLILYSVSPFKTDFIEFIHMKKPKLKVILRWKALFNSLIKKRKSIN